MTPAGLLPLCPTCFDRVLAWTAAKCPSCSKDSPVAECDGCQKSRAGAFVPEEAIKGGSGGAQRFVCSDCMEEMLDSDSSDAMFNAVLAVGLSVVAVRYYGRFTFLPIATVVLFAASLLFLVLWWQAAARRRLPKKRMAATWKRFAARLEKAISKRPAARAR